MPSLLSRRSSASRLLPPGVLVRLARGVLVCLAAATAACVAPARSYGAYEGKAVETADAVLSAVQTARQATAIGADDNGFAAYLAITASDAEDAARSAQGAFDSIQPPDARSDRLRAELDRLIERAVELVSRVRIQARRAALARVSLAGPLREVAADLERFVREHG